jgi:protein TonB
MFEGIEAGGEEGGGKRAAVSTGVSLVVYGIIGLIVVAVGGSLGASAIQEDKPVEVTFQAPAPPPPVAELPPPPPPAPKPAGHKKSNKPPSAPAIISDEELAEANENEFSATADRDTLLDLGAPSGDEDGIGLAPPPPPPPPAPVVKDEVEQAREKYEPVYVKDDSQRPRAADGNAPPVYPENARKGGREGDVVLRFIVTESGVVVGVEVVSGDEPFIGAAIAVVRQWRYQPARVDGRATAAYHRVRIPFRLKS